MMTNIVEVNGVEVFAYHGCMDEEAKLGGKFIVDVALYTNFMTSAETDLLSDTIDYVRVREIIVEQMAIRSKLLEHVANRILQHFKAEFPRLQKAKIKIRKIDPPIGGVVKDVAVIIEG